MLSIECLHAVRRHAVLRIWSIANPGCPRFTCEVQSELSLEGAVSQDPVPADRLQVGSSQVPLRLVRNPRARRYILRLCGDGSARITIPRAGSVAAAREFALRHSAWIERERTRLKKQSTHPSVWRIGSEFLFRGSMVRIDADCMNGNGIVRFGSEHLRLMSTATDLRVAIESHLRQLAAEELPSRLLAYASVHHLRVRKVTVRNQRTRWGSCSRRGTISLNWRLIQTPPFVRDYICLHELMHLREMNHSLRFWRQVESVCPYYPLAERWLKTHARLLH